MLTQGKAFDWSLLYERAANGGNGEMRVTLGKESVTLALKPGQKADGAMLDRFGLFNSTDGGQMVKIHLDDLKHSARQPRTNPPIQPAHEISQRSERPTVRCRSRRDAGPVQPALASG